MTLTYQTTRDVYSTKPACTTVKIIPGASPSTEYEYGNDMIARQIYSEKSKAAVYSTIRAILVHFVSCHKCVFRDHKAKIEKDEGSHNNK